MRVAVAGVGAPTVDLSSKMLLSVTQPAGGLGGGASNSRLFVSKGGTHFDADSP